MMHSSSAAAAASASGLPSPSSSAPPPMLASSTSSTASSPCAACKFLRRKCQPDCVFAPYFPPDQPQKFVHVHRVFGASNVTKLLNELHPYQREDAVNSLAYEADMRLRDPVYGCVGVISLLQHQLRQLQFDLSLAKAELSKYQQQQQHHHSSSIATTPPVAVGPTTAMLAMGMGLNRQDHQLFGAGQALARNYEAEIAAVAAARMGANHSGPYYDHGGVMAGAAAAAAMSSGGMVGGVGMLGGQFLKQPSMAGGDERPSVGPS